MRRLSQDLPASVIGALITTGLAAVLFGDNNLALVIGILSGLMTYGYAKLKRWKEETSGRKK